MRAMVAMVVSILLEADRLLAATLGQQHLGRAPTRRSTSIALSAACGHGYSARGQLDRRPDRLAGIFEFVIILEIRFEPLEDVDRVLEPTAR